jgi:hypothetical protein
LQALRNAFAAVSSAPRELPATPVGEDTSVGDADATEP